MRTEEKTDKYVPKMVRLARVNVKSLASESRIIREEIKKSSVGVRSELDSHRRYKVRPDARHAQLALAFLRGRPYRQVESRCHTPPDLNYILRKVSKFRQPFYLDLGMEWRDDSAVASRLLAWLLAE